MIESDGVRLSSLVNTPEGQKKVNETMTTIEQLIDPQSQDKQARVQEILRGDILSLKEDQAYLSSLGVNTKNRHSETGDRYQEILDIFSKTRASIGNALEYQIRETKPAEERPIPWLSQGRLRIYNITPMEAQDVFTRGWDSIKSPPQGKGGK